MDNLKFQSWKHVTENFQLFGFSSHENAILQISKELMDNSADSISYNTNIRNEISIKLVCNNESGIVMISVADTGCGIENIDSVMQLYSSSELDKSRTCNKYKSGKYGIGLTASLYYSFVHTNQPVR